MRNMENTDLVVLDLLLDSDDDDDLEIFELISSSSSSDEEPPNPQKRNSAEKLFIYLTIPNYEQEEFKSHFRLYPETFDYVLSLLGPKLEETGYVSGCKPIPAKEQLLLALWLMATPDSYRSICEKFQIPEGTAFRAVRRVSRALHLLAPQFIKWPKNEHAVQVMTKYEQNSAFPGIIGAIDGTHIEIEAPKEDKSSYINRKQYASIQVQAVCTHDLVFTSVFAGCTGCCHDARVFRLSPVAKYMEHPEEYFPNDAHLVGDAAYGINKNLMVPYKDNGRLTERQRNFNFCLSSARMAIERAFGVLKARWRRIRNCLPMIKIEKIPEFILATCVLHNICILRGDLIVPVGPTQQPVTRGTLINSSDSRAQAITDSLIIRAI